MNDSHNTIAAQGAAHMDEQAQVVNAVESELLSLAQNSKELRLIFLDLLDETPDDLVDLFADMIMTIYGADSYIDKAYELKTMLVNRVKQAAQDRIAAREPE